MAFTDFPNGLSSAADYLNTQHHIRADLQTSVADISSLVVGVQYENSLKEIICSLLAGRGIKLPNIQICISLNIAELLGLGGLQSALRNALTSLSGAMDRFLDHMRIDEVLGRLNNVLAEAANIANMINFCSSPINPVAIPNMLEQSMQSFLGAGKGILDGIGSLIPGEIGGCLIPGQFNTGLFSGGLLGRISDNFAAVSAGTATDAFIDSCVADVNQLVNQIDTLIEAENNVSGTYDNGGSDFIVTPRDVNPDMGVLHNAVTAGIQGNTNIASQLKGLYDPLKSYPVVDNDGNPCNNIFEKILEPELIKLLQQQSNPTPEVSEQQPVYNYCGQVVGFTKVVAQKPADASVGLVPGEITQPGFNAGGLNTDLSDDADEEGTGGTTINNTTVVNNLDDPNVLSATIITSDATDVVALTTDALPTDSSWFFTMNATAKRTDVAGAVGSIKIEGLADNSAGVYTVFVDPANKTTFNMGAATGIDVEVTTNGTDVEVIITGVTGQPFKWAIRLEFHEVQ